jgi:hypothetical protein
MLDLKKNFKELETGLKFGYIQRGSNVNLTSLLRGTDGEMIKNNF